MQKGKTNDIAIEEKIIYFVDRILNYKHKDPVGRLPRPDVRIDPAPPSMLGGDVTMSASTGRVLREAPYTVLHVHFEHPPFYAEEE